MQEGRARFLALRRARSGQNTLAGGPRTLRLGGPASRFATALGWSSLGTHLCFTVERAYARPLGLRARLLDGPSSCPLHQATELTSRRRTSHQ